jgi:Methyltransferase FkbM domain
LNTGLSTRSHLGPWLRQAQRLKDLLVADEVKSRKVWAGVCRGCCVPINLRHQFRWPLGLYEIEIAEFVRAFVGPGDTCYDIGAAEGYYSVCFAKRSAPGGLVYAFEPEPAPLRLLRQAVSLNSDSPIEIVEAAVGAMDASPPRVVSIDSLVMTSKFRPPSLLKIDVEGGETAVLAGAARVIKEHRPWIIVEVHSALLERECAAMLCGWDYDLKPVERKRWLPEFRPIEHNRWLVATPSGRA